MFAPNLVFLEENFFATLREFSDMLKFTEGDCPPPLPRRYTVRDNLPQAVISD